LGAARIAWLTIDADDFKRRLLMEAIADGTYEGTIKPSAVREREALGERFYPLELASLVHEESSRLAKHLQDQAIVQGFNIVIDTVLSSRDSANRLGRDLAAVGYSIEVIDVEVPYELSEARISRRWREAYENAGSSGDALGGRWVPSEYARSVYAGTGGRSRPEIVSQYLATTCPAVMRYRRYRTLAEGTERLTEVDKVRVVKGAPLTDKSDKEPS
jgi:hypothetical protein